MSGSVVLLVLTAAALHAVWNFASRSSRGSLPVLWLSLLLAGLAFLPVSLAAAWANPPGRVGVAYLLATATIHAVYFTLLATAYRQGHISLVYPIARGSGVAGTALVAFLTGVDAFNPLAVVAIGCVCLGILLIGQSGRRTAASSPGRSVLAAVGVGLTIILYSLLDKVAVSPAAGGPLPTGQLHPVVYIDGVFLGTAILMAPYVAWRVRPAELAQAWAGQKRYILTIGPCSLVTYLLILLAYRLAPVSSVVAMRESSVVFGSILGFCLLREPPTALRLAGIGLVTVGLVLLRLA